jgi:hypothetical protein
MNLDKHDISIMEISNIDVAQESEGLMMQSMEDANYEDGSFGLYSDEGNLRGTGTGGGGGFDDTGGNDNGNGYNDPAPLGTFPCLLLLCLAVGYGVYCKRENTIRKGI